MIEAFWILEFRKGKKKKTRIAKNGKNKIIEKKMNE